MSSSEPTAPADQPAVSPLARPLSIVAGLIAGWSVVQLGSTLMRRSGQIGLPIDSDGQYYTLLASAVITLAASLYAVFVLRKGDIENGRKLFYVTAVAGLFGFVGTLMSIFALVQSRKRD